MTEDTLVAEECHMFIEDLRALFQGRGRTSPFPIRHIALLRCFIDEGSDMEKELEDSVESFEWEGRESFISFYDLCSDVEDLPSEDDLDADDLPNFIQED